MRKYNKVAILLTSASIILFTYSTISMTKFTVNVITQSPFYLYNNTPYIVTIILTLITTIILTLINTGAKKTLNAILIIILWFMVLAEPYLTYINALPLYNDQLGFVEEVLAMINTGRAVAIQGGVTTLGHAYFTSSLALLTGINGINAAILVQLIMPIIYAVTYLALTSDIEDVRARILTSLIILASFLNPFWYGRTPFALIFLALLTLIIYKLFTKGVSYEQNTLRITMYILYAAYAISDPTSLFIPLIFMAASIFNKRYTLIFIATSLIWITINLIAMVSGSLYSALMELIDLFTAPSNPVLSLLTPGVNEVIMIYYRLRELNVLLMYIVGLIIIYYIINRIKKRNQDFVKDLLILIYIISVITEAAALAINRWGMVPYTLYTLSIIPIMLIIYREYYNTKKIPLAAIMAITLSLIIMAPAVKWGYAAIAFPTPHDIAESQFLTNYTQINTQICTAGAHQILQFYSYINNKTLNQYALNLPMGSNIPSTCHIIAIFYRAMNTYRMDMTLNQLMQTINQLDNNYNIIYKDETWTVWAK
ncbi:hypothetical protein [Caldivirga maquilingensis]|uniref:Uncharacterized protein n=1 Tax=Caldivirga maquilingensis (strain ATCC 700844 / DSM 13496 / JCM 10307 / IC-167) TaxID=397948 RepID=A8M954_CALMQ|nr:hypothetical protein [Caldivirga maquilingensis]ABW02273.1 hypothetical protein Cmaq_1448 [Caldivirga maquilingensis IC-167]